MLFDFSQTPQPQRYRLMSQSIIPRPIAWILTEGKTLNIAPFSFFSGISSSPPSVMVAIGHKRDGSPKDTLRNIRTTKKCVICSVAPEALEKMHFSSAELSIDESEADCYAIETRKVLEEYPPMIKKAPSAFFCTLIQEVALEGSKTVPLFLKIDHMYLDEHLQSAEGTFEPALIGRVGSNYMGQGEKITAPDMPT